MRQLIVLSGSIASGKSTLAELLGRRHDARGMSTKALLAETLRGTAGSSRAALIRAGDRQDRATGGAWVVDALVRRLDVVPEEALVVVDAVRTKDQVDRLRQAFGPTVVHVHLTASPESLANRYEERRVEGPLLELGSYEEVQRNRTEHSVARLIEVADIVIDTDLCDPDGVLTRVAAHLGLFGRAGSRLVDVLVGGQFGSEGKGNIARYLSSEYDLLVRSGGPNAGHSIPTDTDSGTHVQHHLPSGTTTSDAQLLLTPGAVLYPSGLLDEIANSRVEAGRLWIDPQATIITDAHRTAEGELSRTIGSTGQGVGMATAGRIVERSGGTLLAKDIEELRPYLRPSFEVIEEAMAEGGRILVEGTQGTGLSLLHGDYPWVTSRDTTASGLLAEAGIPPSRVNRVIMVCRTFPIRVQDPPEEGRTSGPMHREISWAEVARRSGLDEEELKRQEHTTTTHRLRRVGEFDWSLLHKASALNGPTDIALTFADQLDIRNSDARRFEQLTRPTLEFIAEVERVSSAHVSLISTRWAIRSIIDRRHW